jgi:hypothetical protein
VADQTYNEKMAAARDDGAAEGTVQKLSTDEAWVRHMEPLKVPAVLSFARWRKANCKGTLDLSRCSLVSLPWADLRVVAQQIICLDVSYNALAEIPGDFLAVCTNMRALKCGNNRLLSLSAEIGKCTALEVLNCSYNRLSSLPAELGKCTALEELGCSNNQLSSLPAELGACTAIRELWCSHNHLSSLPAELGACTALQTLDCSHNQLPSLPAELGACTALHLLSCGGNQLTSLPVKLGLLAGLEVFDCLPNPFTEGAPTTHDELRAAALAQVGRLTKRATSEVAGQASAAAADDVADGDTTEKVARRG